MGIRIYKRLDDNTYISTRIWAGMFGAVIYGGLSALGLLGIIALIYSLT